MEKNRTIQPDIRLLPKQLCLLRHNDSCTAHGQLLLLVQLHQRLIFKDYTKTESAGRLILVPSCSLCQLHLKSLQNCYKPQAHGFSSQKISFTAPWFSRHCPNNVFSLLFEFRIPICRKWAKKQKGS
ncbi:uncharacterized protein LOC124721208 isoform X2 [Schistocerca piceifrons]|uniref:uncharacterized protein LOC124721208 isoform X2 n=1 Tax=Schistocerca piceifrons TaxID=274613 RepID=UPI001F5F2D44|nr:uncharacterized protein LOC124721208 isoform X2 [Schistocerca piceifrons]